MTVLSCPSRPAVSAPAAVEANRTDTTIMEHLPDHPGLPGVFGGVDPHADTHHAALIDALGRPLGDASFPATRAGYQNLHDWLCRHGRPVAVGIEGTGSYGAGLARHLSAAGLRVIEVDRPDRRTRRAKGKSDPIDAYAAAAAAASGRACGTPKSRDGAVEAIRALKVARTSAIKARTQAINQIRALLVTAPEPIRAAAAPLTGGALITHLTRYRPGTGPHTPATAVKTALRVLARRHTHLTAEITDLDAAITDLVTRSAPQLLQLPGVGPETASQLLITAGDNPGRVHTPAAFAALCGAAPVPASSGRTHRHRLSRGGDRQANRALHMIVLTRMRHDPRTRAYVDRRTTEGLSKPEIIRCLKRYLANELHKALTTPHQQITPPHPPQNPPTA